MSAVRELGIFAGRGVAEGSAGRFGGGSLVGQRGEVGAEVSGVMNVYHTVPNKEWVQSVVDGIDPFRLNPRHRFGAALYVSEVPDTTLAELAHHNTIGVETIRFEFNRGSAKVLDLVNPKVAKSWGYLGGEINTSTRSIGERASAAGFNAIRFASERGPGANIAVLNNFDELLSPQMIMPTPQIPGM